MLGKVRKRDLVVIILNLIALLVFTASMKLRDDAEIVNLISLLASFTSIGLASVAIIYAFYQSNRSESVNDGLRGLLEELRMRMEEVVRREQGADKEGEVIGSAAIAVADAARSVAEGEPVGVIADAAKGVAEGELTGGSDVLGLPRICYDEKYLEAVERMRSVVAKVTSKKFRVRMTYACSLSPAESEEVLTRHAARLAVKWRSPHPGLVHEYEVETESIMTDRQISSLVEYVLGSDPRVVDFKMERFY